MKSLGLDNDTRGWIMCIISGIACVVGSAIICIDVVVRLIPGQEEFRVQESNVFLACSLSLSFGVMMYSSLYSMLPSSLHYFADDQWEEHAAGLLMMACFVGGFFGIQVISRLLHQLLPSHVVDCDHSHQDVIEEEHVHSHLPSRQHSIASRGRQRSIRRMSTHIKPAPPSHMMELHGNGLPSEGTPLLASEQAPSIRMDISPHRDVPRPAKNRSRAPTLNRRPSMMKIRVMSFMKDTKANCDEFGPCFGYSDPCGQECFKHVGSRSTLSRAPTFSRTTTSSMFPQSQNSFKAVPEDENDQSLGSTPRSPTAPTFHTHTHPHRTMSRDATRLCAEDSDLRQPSHASDRALTDEEYGPVDEDVEAQHHHHVSNNAFMSIGLQTVIAIALHKFPEGFVTYATNHANPSLGFNVFMALFVHNIAEGFSMALPLYMALGSRFKAIAWTSLLGGASQPFGAGLAALWFAVAGRTSMTLNSTAYGCLFGVTAGIMVSVALQLFVESLSLNHNRNLSILFAFTGMILLGVSNAINADSD